MDINPVGLINIHYRLHSFPVVRFPQDVLSHRQVNGKFIWDTSHAVDVKDYEHTSNQ